MSIESLAPCTQAPASSMTFPPAADPGPAPARLPGENAAPTSAAPRSLPERRLRVARDLDVRINGLEQDIQQVGQDLAQSRAATTAILRELQQRSTSLTTEILRAGARLAQQGSAHEKSARHLEHRIGSRLQEIDCALKAMSAELQVQTEGQYELKQRHDSLTRLHEHLDRIVNRQGRNLDILSAEFQQRVEILRISIEELQVVFQMQQESLTSLTLEYEQLALQTVQLQGKLGELASRLDVHVNHTHQRLRSQATGLAAVALLGLGLITYCQLNPVAVPDNVSGQLAMMESGLAHQTATTTALMALGRRQDKQLSALTAALEAEQQETRRLRQDGRRASRRLATLDRQLAELRTTATPPSAVHALPGASATWQQPSAPGSITLPAALPGSRPDF